MSGQSPVTVWQSLALQGISVGGGVPFIDGGTFQPDIDTTNLQWDPVLKIFKPKILDVLDYVSTAKKLSIWRTLQSSGVAVSCPADATEDILATISIAAATIGANGILRLSAEFSFTSSANNKTPRIRFNGIAGTDLLGTIVLTTNAQAEANIVIFNRNLVNSQRYRSMFRYGPAYPSNIVQSYANGGNLAIDSTIATSIVITGQKQTAGETFTLEAYSLEVLSKD
jgi:hypothetical protein